MTVKTKKCDYCDITFVCHHKKKYCSDQCKVDAYKERESKRELEFNFEECEIIKNEYNRLLLRYRNKLYLFTSCYSCKQSILKKADNSFYCKTRHFCSQLCMSKVAGSERTMAQTIKLQCDNCGTMFRRQLYHYNKTIYNFCNQTCVSQAQKKDGLINKLYTKTMLDNHGVKSPLQSKKILHKAMKTAKVSCKKNQISRAEIYFLSILEKYFDKIMQQKQVRFWPIDFYLVEHDIYLQLDGIHWHGLDKMKERLNELALSSQHYKTILNKTNNDERQNEWFLKKNMKLIRITDYQVYNDAKYAIDMIINALSKNLTSRDCFEQNIKMREAYMHGNIC